MMNRNSLNVSVNSCISPNLGLMVAITFFFGGGGIALFYWLIEYEDLDSFLLLVFVESDLNKLSKSWNFEECSYCYNFTF